MGIHNGIIHSGPVQVDTILPNWSLHYPTLKIHPKRMFRKALVVDNFKAPTSTAIASYSSSRQKTLLGADAPWVSEQGTINVLLGVASSPTVDSTKKIATKDLGVADIEIEETVRASSNSAFEGITFRYVDNDENYILSLRAENGTQGLYLWRRVPNDTQTLLQSYADTSVVNGSERRIKVIAKGTSIKCFLDGVERISVTSSNYQTATKHGILMLRGAALDWQARKAL